MTKYVIRLSGDPVWFTDGIEDVFSTEEQAIEAIREEIADCEEAVKLGYMDDCNFEDFRIVELVS